MIDYKVTDTQLSNIADAIRTRGSTSTPLVFPNGFISAIENLPSEQDTALIEGTISEYTNSMVSQVRAYAFYGYYSLASVNLPNATSIGSSAFCRCPRLTSINLPNASYIGNYAFSYCSVLTSVNLPEATSIGNYAFQSCYSLTSVNLPEASYIGSSAFNYCSALTSVNLPEATSIESNAFNYCSVLTSVNLSKATIIGNSAFQSCYSLTSVNLPEATSIGNCAFNYCSALTSVNLPNASYIGSSAFYYCSVLTSVNLSKATIIGSSAFQSCYSLTSINLSNASYIGSNAFGTCSALTSVNLPNASYIGSSAFRYCRELSTVSIGESFSSFNTSTFALCYHLLSLYLPASHIVYLPDTKVFASTPISNYTASTGGVYGSIYVPLSYYTDYLNAIGWQQFSSRIIPIESTITVTLNCVNYSTYFASIYSITWQTWYEWCAVEHIPNPYPFVPIVTGDGGMAGIMEKEAGNRRWWAYKDEEFINQCLPTDILEETTYYLKSEYE